MRRVREEGGERGSATVWVLTLCSVVCSLALAAMTVGAALVARHRAESAADLAALAAAQAATQGGVDVCGQARRVSAAARARLIGCEPAADGSVLVVTQVPVGGLLARFADMPPARARARAGGHLAVDEGPG